MLAHFRDKKAKILVIESSAALRTMLTGVIRAIGYTDITTSSEVKASLSILEAERFDWVITRLQPEGEINGLDLLKVALDYKESLDIKVTLLLDEEELYCVGMALELGLLSYHTNYKNKEGFEAELQELETNLNEYNYDSMLASACYVRKHLKNTKNHNYLNQFEKILIDKPCSHPSLITCLAESEFILGNQEKGLSILKQAMMMNPEGEDRIKKIAASYDINEDELSNLSSKVAKSNILGIHHCLVVISDEEERNKAKFTISKMGFISTTIKHGGQKTLEWIKDISDKPDLVIFEWSLHDVPGPIFLQRIKKEVATDCPIVILAQGIGSNEKPLLDELGVSKVINAPHTNEELIAACVWAVHQYRHPKASKSLLIKIKNALKKKKFGEALNYRAAYFKDKNITEADKKYVDAEVAYAKGGYEKCRDLCVEAMSLAGGTPVSNLNLLGKALMQLREFDAAVRCLQNANTISPYNLGRICQIAECHIESGNKEAYDATIEQAKKIDVGAEELQETRMKAALIEKDSKTAKDLAAKLASLKGILAFTNNRAVALIRSEDYTGGEALYREALNAVPKEKSETSAVLRYNLALAYARQNSLEEAEATLIKAAKAKNQRMHLKIKALLSRVKKARENNEMMVFKDSTKINKQADQQEAQESYSEAQIDKMMKEITIDHCCYKVFVNPEDTEAPQLKNLLANEVKFTPRKALKKDRVTGLAAA